MGGPGDPRRVGAEGDRYGVSDPVHLLELILLICMVLFFIVCGIVLMEAAFRRLRRREDKDN